MQQNQRLAKASYGIHLPFEKVIASACIFAFLLSPTAPLFASEDPVSSDVSTITPSDEEATNIADTEPSEETETSESPESEGDQEIAEENTEEVTVAMQGQTEEHHPVESSDEPEVLEDNDTESDVPLNPQDGNEAHESENLDEPITIDTQDPLLQVDDSIQLGTSTQDSQLAVVTEATTSDEAQPEVPQEIPTLSDEIVNAPEIPVLQNEEEKEIPQENLTTTQPVVVTNDTDGNNIAFQKDECVSVSEGTYYCTKVKTERVPLHIDRIFAAPDEDGDKEIFVEKDSVITQVTHNILDDDAPYFDESANRMVWHRLIDGRYQIISYDVPSAEETQITFDRYNNMNPNSFGDTLVWQGWVGNDWEIFMLTGNEQKMITDNTTHDIAASINGTHIVWQSFEGDVWRMKLYDIRTGAIETIGDADGSIQNPRFVLVYDTTLESGDIETRGYDLRSGEVVPLSATPKQIPTEIPDPEQTGEKRALVSTNTQPKSKAEDADDDQGNASGVGPDPTFDDEGVLVIPPMILDSEVVASSTDDIVMATSTLEIPLIDSYTHIEDLIVPPLATQTEIVPQDTVAEVE